MSLLVQSLFASTPAVPAVFNTSIAGRGPQMVNLKFFTTTSGDVTSFRYFRDASEPCTGHNGTIIDDRGNVVVRMALTEACATARVSEWITVDLTTPAPIVPGAVYNLLMGPFQKYPYTASFFSPLGYRNGDLSVIPNPTTTGRPSTRPGAIPGRRFATTNFFVDVGFVRTANPPLARCNSIPPPATLAAGFQNVFNASENVTGLSVSTRASSPTPIGVRFIASRDGYILAIRWYKDPLEPIVPRTGIIYREDTKQAEAEVLFAGSCASGWISQTLSSPLRIRRGFGYIAVVNSVTRYPLAPNYFATPKTSGELVAVAGMKGRSRSRAIPTQTFSRGGNPWVDVVFSGDREWDCEFYSGDGTPCDDGQFCTEGDQCSGGTCQGGPIRQCPNSLNPFTEQCIFWECNPRRGGGCMLTGTREVGYPCNDFDLCTIDGCDGDGSCVGTFSSAACPTCVGANVVTEGFEQGGASWNFAGSFLTPDVSNESPRNGTKSLKFGAAFTDETAVSSAYALIVGTKYTATVWVRGVFFTSIGVVDASNGNMLAEVKDILLGDSGDWKRVPLIFTATVATVKIRIFQQQGFSSGSYFDDISICEIA